MPKTKICERCKEEKAITFANFGIDVDAKDGYKPYCRDCSPAVIAERRERHRSNSREWARNNPDKAKEIQEQSAERNRESVRAYHRKRRAEEKESGKGSQA